MQISVHSLFLLLSFGLVSLTKTHQFNTVLLFVYMASKLVCPNCTHVSTIPLMEKKFTNLELYGFEEYLITVYPLTPNLAAFQNRFIQFFSSYRSYCTVKKEICPSYIPLFTSPINVISAGNHSTESSSSFVSHFAASCSFRTRSPDTTSAQKQSIER